MPYTWGAMREHHGNWPVPPGASVLIERCGCGPSRLGTAEPHNGEMGQVIGFIGSNTKLSPIVDWRGSTCCTASKVRLLHG